MKLADLTMQSAIKHNYAVSKTVCLILPDLVSGIMISYPVEILALTLHKHCRSVRSTIFVNVHNYGYNCPILASNIYKIALLSFRDSESFS